MKIARPDVCGLKQNFYHSLRYSQNNIQQNTIEKF